MKAHLIVSILVVCTASLASAGILCKDAGDCKATYGTIEGKHTAFRVTDPRINGHKVSVSWTSVTAFCQKLFPQSLSPAFGTSLRADREDVSESVAKFHESMDAQMWSSVDGDLVANVITCFVNDAPNQ